MHLILARAGAYEQGASRTVPLVLASVPGEVTPLYEDRPGRLDHPRTLDRQDGVVRAISGPLTGEARAGAA